MRGRQHLPQRCWKNRDVTDDCVFGTTHTSIALFSCSHDVHLRVLVGSNEQPAHVVEKLSLVVLNVFHCFTFLNRFNS